jgi:hypothetical protein
LIGLETPPPSVKIAERDLLDQMSDGDFDGLDASFFRLGDLKL